VSVFTNDPTAIFPEIYTWWCVGYTDRQLC